MKVETLTQHRVIELLHRQTPQVHFQTVYPFVEGTLPHHPESLPLVIVTHVHLHGRQHQLELMQLEVDLVRLQVHGSMIKAVQDEHGPLKLLWIEDKIPKLTRLHAVGRTFSFSIWPCWIVV